MRDAVQITITDVINRLHHLKGDDRCALLIEHMEWLIDDEEEVTSSLLPIRVEEEK